LATGPSRYRIWVANHISDEWRAAAAIVSLSPGYDLAGLPITTLVAEVHNQGELMRIIDDLHAAQLAILRADQICAT
jgi:hypothetical protein